MVVKFPSSREGEPDKRFCGVCGRRCQPLVNDNVGFGPCIEGADNPLECGDLKNAIVGAHALAAAMERELNPEWAALIRRLGIPVDVVTQWVEKAKRVQADKDWLHRGAYEGMGGSPWVSALCEWVGERDSDERLLLIIDELRVSLDPTEGGSRSLSWVEICAWFERVADRARDNLADPGDWEFGEGEG